jgi:glycosyltransferase involved in cell wall biosynthesis
MMHGISIITVVLNNKQGLLETVKSVLSQTIPVEYIIIDGGSTDGTLDVIDEFRPQFAHVVSEKDSGVYNAMNKGIAKATANYVLFLNAGDSFSGPHALSLLTSNSNGEDLVYGDLIVKSQKGEHVYSYPDTLDFNFFVEDTLPHPCTLIKRELFLNHGLYREDIRICADWAFFIDAIAKGNVAYRHVAKPIAVFVQGGLSSDQSRVTAEKSKYLSEEYDFFYRGYKKQKNLEQKIQYLRKSRLIRMLSKMFPPRLRDVIYK